MRAWAFLLGGLTVWALHFFVLYAIGSVLPGRHEAHWLVVAATLPALAAVALILWKAVAAARGADTLDSWIAKGGALGAAVSLVAVVGQCVPALML